jgi:hypothetical protein
MTNREAAESLALMWKPWLWPLAIARRIVMGGQ